MHFVSTHLIPLLIFPLHASRPPPHKSRKCERKGQTRPVYVQNCAIEGGYYRLRKLLKLCATFALHSSTHRRRNRVRQLSLEAKGFVILYEVLRSKFVQAHMKSSKLCSYLG